MFQKLNGSYYLRETVKPWARKKALLRMRAYWHKNKDKFNEKRRRPRVE
jgi:hypothetical protein